MALDVARFNRRDFYWFVLDAMLSKDELGWQLFFRTPLFGFGLMRNWQGYHFTRRTNGWWFGLLVRWPSGDGDKMYRWNWEKESVVADQSTNQIDPKFFDQVAQIAHFSTTYAICFTFAAFGSLRWALLMLLACTVYGLIHEFVWDPREENAITRGSDLKDFLYLMGGAINGFLLALVLRHFLR